jgi:putative acyl-CoA dehydrogenase
VGTAGIMRHAVAEAVHHTCGREAFGRKLVDQPLMQNVLADLALESEAATALALRLARAFDAGDDETESLFRRIVTPATKFWICKRGPALAAEAMEVLGGNGYVEDGMLARIYRQMPLNSIWEGSGNIMCLDVLRAARRHPRSLEVLTAELAAAAGRNRHYDAFAARLTSACLDPERLEQRGRRIAQGLALALQASLLLRHAPPFVAEAFCQSRLGGDWGQTFGTLPSQTAFADIIARAWPAAAT